MRILVLNPGSSTLKAAVIVDTTGEVLGATTVDWPAGVEQAAAVVRGALDQLPSGAEAVGYRVVHGGSRYTAPARVDAPLLEAVEELDALAPLHNLRAASVMHAAMELLPDLPHIACFDTAFHATLPEEAWRYPLPASWVERLGIRRYGFHGLSVAWATRRAGELLRRPMSGLRMVVAHLGSGCSVTAVEGGASVDTSMGFTPFEGVMMATRAGSIDPGILLRLAGEGVSVEQLADGLAHRSGFAAIAGISDVREVERRAAAGDAHASLALDMFARRTAAAIASAATALTGLDAIVFTGGIGEHSAVVRGAVIGRLTLLGVPQTLVAVEGDGIIAAGPPAIVVIGAREDLVIAGEVAASASDSLDLPSR